MGGVWALLGSLLKRLSRGRSNTLEEPHIEHIEVESLCFREGRIEYEFSLRLSKPSEILSLNRGLNAQLEGDGWRGRKRVERGLGWATLMVYSKRGGYMEASGRVWGETEDFTLSAYGTRVGRALLKDETIWHPIPSVNLVSWGLSGVVESFLIAGRECEGRLVAPGEHRGQEVFEGRFRARHPGVSVIIGPYRRVSLESGEAYLWGGLDRGGVRSVLGEIDSLSAPFMERGLLASRIDRVVEVWDENDPFAQENMIAVRSRVLRGLASGKDEARYEVLVSIASLATASTRLKALDAYWFFESLPEALAMAASQDLEGFEKVVESRVRQLEGCVRDTLGGKAPIYGSGLPRGARQRAIIRCGGPLALWRLVESAGPESLWSIVSCVSRAGGYGEEDVRRCIEAESREVSEEVFSKGNLLER
ncbi:MAG: hypothetical protein F7C09_00285 [Aeropyrum sp.]|nr:hypothetical protein [Aeropyrum sp.]